MSIQTNKTTRLTLGCLIVICIFSCRKDLSSLFDAKSNPDAQWAVDYFNTVLQPKEGNQVSYKNLNKISSSNGIGKRPNMKTPMWVRARASKTLRYDFVETPLMYTSKITRAMVKTGEVAGEAALKASFDRLVIYKNKKGKINQRVISYIPDQAYLDRHSGDISHNKIESLDKDFDGFLTYSTWDGTVLFRLRVDKGVARKLKVKLQPLQTGATLKLNKLGSAGQSAGNHTLSTEPECYDLWEIEYETTCYYENPDDTIPKSCDPPVEVNRTWIGQVCDEGDGPIDCSDPANFENAECGGGEEGCRGCETDPEIPLSKEINNDVADSCLKATIAEAIAGNKNIKNVIADIINKFAQKDNGIVVNITDGLTSGSATTQITSSDPDHFVISVKFNAGYFSDISKEAVTTRLIHEAVHAYLLYTDNDYKNLAETEQHNYLFTNFMDEMGDYLMDKYGLNESEAYGLAWSGTDIFDNADGEDTFLTKDDNFTSKSDLLAAFVGFLSNDAQTKKGTPNCPNN